MVALVHSGSRHPLADIGADFVRSSNGSQRGVQLVRTHALDTWISGTGVAFRYLRNLSTAADLPHSSPIDPTGGAFSTNHGKCGGYDRRCRWRWPPALPQSFV